MRAVCLAADNGDRQKFVSASLAWNGSPDEEFGHEWGHCRNAGKCFHSWLCLCRFVCECMFVSSFVKEFFGVSMDRPASV